MDLGRTIRLDDRSYEVVGVLGRGGMGIVFKAFDAPLNRFVAIKIMAPHVASNAVARQRFLREAQATAAIAHQHVIAIHGVALWQEMPYVVMPYLDCVSLQQRLTDVGILSLRETLRIAVQVSSGLMAAHAQGLIHRDVKPANILLERNSDRAVLTDFGLACALDDVRLTQTDTLIGTPQYMSPEQASDLPLDWRTDLFSLGSVLYECCTGRPAFHAATSYGMVRKIVDTSPPPANQINHDVPDWLAELIAKLLSKDPAQRFESAEQVHQITTQCLAHMQQPQLVSLPVPNHSTTHSSNSLKTWSIAMGMGFVIGAVMLVSSGNDWGLAFNHFNEEAKLPAKSERVESNQPASTDSEPEDSAVTELDEQKLQNVVATATDTDELSQSSPLPESIKETVPTFAKEKGKTKKGKRKFESADEAYEIGISFYNARRYEEARRPFEAALKLTEDTKTKIRIYRALMASYRHVPEFQPMRTAVEFIIENSDRAAERSLARRSFMSFAFQRGQQDNLIKRYETMHSQDAKHYLPVYLLAELYERGNPKKAIEFNTKLQELDAANRTNSKVELTEAETLKIARMNARLATQYANDKQYVRAAELFLKIAPEEKATQAWHMKEAASAYAKAGETDKAMKVLKSLEKVAPEKRNDQLTHYYHRQIADLYTELEQFAKALPHYEIALKKTTIEGYINDMRAAIESTKRNIERGDQN